MSNTLQYLDYEGLKYYDKKLKAQLSSLIPENGKDGQDGQDGEDGLTPEFRIQDDKLQYRYLGQDDDAWVDLGNVKGADGTIGADGTSVTITSTEEVKDEADNVIGIKVTFSDGKEITINHGKDGADGKDGDELNLLLGEEIKTNVKCGALGIGQTLTANLTLADIVKKLTTTVYEPSTGNSPSATLAIAGPNASVEVGTTITPTLTPGFNDGTFKTYAKGATSSTNMYAGCVPTGYTISRSCTVGKTTTEKELFDSADIEGAFTGLTTHDDSYKIGAETVKYITKINYAASKNSPTNSNGETVSSVKYSASSATGNSTTVTGKYQYYVGKGDVDPTADEIRGVLDQTSNWINTSKKVSIENKTHTKTIFAIPSSYTLTKAFSFNTNDDVTKQFIPKDITIKDAGGNDVSYTMYVQTNGEPGNLLIEFTYA